MKKYGLIVADNGSNWYISGAPDDRWDDDALSQLAEVKGSDFEAVLTVDENGDPVYPSGVIERRNAGFLQSVESSSNCETIVYDIAGRRISGNTGKGIRIITVTRRGVPILAYKAVYFKK
jgi:hypothetical protein